ncbi:MAG: hypothetical protein CL910_19040 [Deltaproteobacteria bacterium]|jgi:mono/diheme cytochrome c family protein|nr:hypothetical protein [Deltaproteobacteria bacterium]
MSASCNSLAPILLVLFAASAAWATDEAGARPSNEPRVDWMLQCQGCHQADGSGAPRSGVPNLVGSVARFLSVPGGREYLVRVPGASGSNLTDSELAAVLNWMVQTFGPAEHAHAAAPYTTAEVTRVRRPPLTEVEALRARLLEQLPTQP